MAYPVAPGGLASLPSSRVSAEILRLVQKNNLACRAAFKDEKESGAFRTLGAYAVAASNCVGVSEYRG